MSERPERRSSPARGLVKRYGRVTALDHADFDLLPGEILAVIGDNGAGKSTLIKALTGAVMPDHGEIRLDGKPIQLPLAARRPRAPASRRSTRTWRCRRRLASPTTSSSAASGAAGDSSARVFRKLDRGEHAERGAASSSPRSA